MTAMALEQPKLTIGFIPLVDCAVLAVAREQGFAAREGLDLTLRPERSWATIRDRLNIGEFDAAHMLAGMPIAASLGIAQAKVATIAPFSLNLNGNAITLSNALYGAMQDAAQEADLSQPAASGAALAAVIAARRRLGKEPLTLAVVYPFSCHNYEMRYWLAAAGIDPDADVRLIVIPPPLMAESLAQGQIDGFCVGEPWNSLAVERSIARIVTTKADIWRSGPEKVLGLRADWAQRNPRTLAALIRALYHAAAWAERPENRTALAEMLARPQYVGAPPSIIARALSGRLVPIKWGAPIALDNFLVLHKQAANFPWRSQALWLYSQMVRWRQTRYSPEGAAVARACFRPDLYRQALADVTPRPVLPGASAKVEGALETPRHVGAAFP
ncbi:MAG: nitrate transporter, partial [Alphaproteobacteria bacterium]